jgi:hypothetical protein
MEKQHYPLKLLFLFGVMAMASLSQAQEFTLTTTTANITSAKALIDLPGLSGNTVAIIIATPLGNTKALNPHPTGAWYYSGKWNIFNSDFALMIPGLTYKVQYFLNPGPNQFLHLVTQLNLGSEGSYIDNPALNNHPNVQFAIFQNHAPDVRSGSWLNPNEAKAGYSTAVGKWYITNINGQPLLKGAAYNIVISAAGNLSSGDSSSCNCPASLPPDGQAKGDLAGMYPDPMVVKILNRPLSNTPPTIGQVLKWNGTEWAPSNVGSTGNNTTYTAAGGIQLTGTELTALYSTAMWNASKLLGRDMLTTPPAAGQVLKWTGGVWAPADDNVSSALTTTAPALVQTFFKTDNTQLNNGQVEINDLNPKRKLSALSHSIVLDKKSRLVISVAISVSGAFCPLGCTNGDGWFVIKVNNLPEDKSTTSFSVGHGTINTQNISNYMIDLNPGTYNIEFVVRHSYKTTQIYPYGKYSSIMVLPL